MSASLPVPQRYENMLCEHVHRRVQGKIFDIARVGSEDKGSFKELRFETHSGRVFMITIPKNSTIDEVDRLVDEALLSFQQPAS
jgi:hypothetical protein